MSRLTDDEIKDIEKRCDISSPFPWNMTCVVDKGFVKIIRPKKLKEEDIYFAVNARQDIPRLLAEVKALRAALKRIYEYKKRTKNEDDYQSILSIQAIADDAIQPKEIRTSENDKTT